MKREDTSTASVVAPPPLIFAAGWVLGLALHLRFQTRVIVGPSRWLGGLLVGTGAGLVAWAVWTMRKAGTDPRPDRPTATLVTDGPFRYTRNPIYLGFAAIYSGLLMAVGTPWPALFLPVVLALIRAGVIEREERYLAARFGDAFADYTAHVRRWL
jgi:protein-S-isoprenylcysteine O-methyltransferase Ste14